MKRFPVCPGVA